MIYIDTLQTKTRRKYTDYLCKNILKYSKQ